MAGTCFADMGNYVTCVDVDESRLDSLRSGIIPFHEPGLDKLVASNCEAGRLAFSSDLAVAMQDSEAVFIAVGTPPGENGDAEMIKYAANAMLATRISFMNEVALMCDHLGVDVEKVRRGIGSDPRIGSSFIYPGCGYGGSCFPRDVRAMSEMAKNAGLRDTIFDAVARRNESQPWVLVERIVAQFGDDLSGRTFALWGLAFKPETDDIRGAPAITIARALCERGARVRAFDPEAMEPAREALAGLEIEYAPGPYDATEGADALIVVTEWRQFRQPDLRRLSQQLTSKTIFDGRNIYDPERCADYGMTCVGIGNNAQSFLCDGIRVQA